MTSAMDGCMFSDGFDGHFLMPAKHLHLVPSYAVDLVLPITRNRTSSTSALVGSLALEKIAKDGPMRPGQAIAAAQSRAQYNNQEPPELRRLHPLHKRPSNALAAPR